MIELTSQIPFIVDILIKSAILFTPVFVYHSSRIRKYTDFKRSNNSNVNVYLIEPHLREQIESFDESLVEEDFRKKVRDFYRILSENFSDEVLVNFHNNINSARITEDIDIIRTHHAAGLYTSDNNILLVPQFAESTLTHELLHLSSCVHRPDDSLIYFGFYQTGEDKDGNKVEFGSSFNEGYTELLNRRLFDANSKCTPSYEYMVSVCRALEKIVGKDFMQECYFKADFARVCHKLSNYLEMDKVEDFLAKTEYLFNLFTNDNGNTMIDYKNIRQMFLEVNNYLIEAYTNRLKMENCLTELRISRFINRLPSKLKVRENNYEFKIDPEKYISEHQLLTGESDKNLIKF